ncbi:MORN repeat protein [Ichthyophthirius multifiliis]|uniref:MORN repeat protein n=1 Tax=Ichthyophthirius multifiliis TaxID=5932 RepID=G0QW48_ICHMU|nr:MORN repeat protein [Ichthyophthirius multifiliis]EGR30551.1 MORN repeat protein [Ichthyophthirius multifiliis]|eukprot:XP_004032138.1 MORN repeat protein [Ichthyophthirius multifiliis]
MFPFAHEVPVQEFCCCYGSLCNVPEELIQQIIQKNLLPNTQVIDAFEFLLFVDQYIFFFDENGKIKENQIQNLSKIFSDKKHFGPLKIAKNTYIFYPSGVIFQGTLDSKGFKQGLGKLSKEDIYIFEGEFQDDLAINKGKETKNNCEYIGDFKNGLYHGFGVLKFPNGRVYKGKFYEHQYNGLGELLNEDGILYVGDWSFGNLKEGKIIYQDNSYYQGELKNIYFRNGEGTVQYLNGSKFEGFWVNDMQINGTFFYDMKILEYFYKGDFINGVPQGNGVFQYPSGGNYEGEVKNGQREGFGIYVYANKNKYIGHWVGNNQEGDGKFYFLEKDANYGDVYSGQFSKGKFQGFGQYIYGKSGKQYIGYWQKDKWHGNGKIIGKDGNILKIGFWQKDKFFKQINEKNLGFPEGWEKYIVKLNQ